MRSYALFVVLASAVAWNPGTICGAEPANGVDPVQKATKKGVDYLLAVHKPNARYVGGSHETGTACLAGLALLESGIDEQNPSLQNIIRLVRRAGSKETKTYHLSLCIMFLDRLGDPGDRPLIQFLAVRLMSGQCQDGGWTYACALTLTPQEEEQLTKIFAKQSKLIRKDPLANPDDQPRAEKSLPDNKEKAPELHPLIGKILSQMQPAEVANGDNSNTQFATLALWCARKHGVPVDSCMKAIDKRFRQSQLADGNWNYSGDTDPSTAAMTCAGLIALAVAYGTGESKLRNQPNKEGPPAEKNDRADLGSDEALGKGLKALGNHIRGPRPADAKKDPGLAKMVSQDLYLLWSLERVGVIYGLPTIGNVDWHGGGTQALVRSQRADGSWIGRYHPDIDTPLALLFLRRANVAKDLTMVLNGKVHDPGTSQLRSGGDLAQILGKTKNDPAPAVPAKTVPVPKAEIKPSDAEAEFEMKVGKLTDEFLKGSPDQRSELVRVWRDAKGAVHTEALARIAVKVMGESLSEIREALAQRLTRMTPSTLQGMLKDEQREIRLAAAVACGLKGNQQLLPDLICVLEDGDAALADAAHGSLQRLCGKDFGPAKGAGAEEKAQAVAAWRKWCKAQR